VQVMRTVYEAAALPVLSEYQSCPEGRAVLNRNTVRRNIAVYHRPTSALDSFRSADGAVHLALDHDAFGGHRGLDSSIRPDDQVLLRSSMLPPRAIHVPSLGPDRSL